MHAFSSSSMQNCLSSSQELREQHRKPASLNIYGTAAVYCQGLPCSKVSDVCHHFISEALAMGIWPHGSLALAKRLNILLLHQWLARREGSHLSKYLNRHKIATMMNWCYACTRTRSPHHLLSWHRIQITPSLNTPASALIWWLRAALVHLLCFCCVYPR